jgi:Flagellar basal body-associated protein FliL.
MKKNILTIIIMAIVLINTVLTAVLIFAIVPAANRTTNLVDKISSIVDLELESKTDQEVSVDDFVGVDIPDQLTINLVSTDGKPHYALLYVTVYANTKSKNYTEEISTKITENANAIKEIVSDEFSKYTMDEVKKNKDAIKKKVLENIQNYFNSDVIVNVTFGNIILQ